MTQPITLRAVALIAAATFLIVCGDTAGKLLTGGGVAPFFVAWSRFALAAVIVVPLSRLTRAEWRAMLDPRVILRAALIAGGISSILTALRTEPIANVYGAFFIGPVVSWCLAAILLRERVTWGRFALLLLGFLGVLLVVRPGAGMGAGMGFALLAGLCYGSYLTATRWLAGRFRPRFLLASQLLIGSVLLAVPGLPQAPAAADTRLILLVAASAAASAAGNYLIVAVSRITPASVVAPLIYVQLIAAAGLGVVVFGDWPDAVAMAGLAVILASGLGGLALVRRGAPMGRGDATK